jgi:hypothetical protein
MITVSLVIARSVFYAVETLSVLGFNHLRLSAWNFTYPPLIRLHGAALKYRTTLPSCGNDDNGNNDTERSGRVTFSAGLGFKSLQETG